MHSPLKPEPTVSVLFTIGHVIGLVIGGIALVAGAIIDELRP